MFLEPSAAKVHDSHAEFPCPTQSICPECGHVLEAILYTEHNQVWMNKNCPVHGKYTELISSDVDFFVKRRRTHFNYPTGVETIETSSADHCPEKCGLCSEHKSTPCQVNIDLTNRCNLNCPICFANANASGRVFDFTLEQLEPILDKTMSLKPNPPFSIMYAGGEPTIHPDFCQAVQMARDKGALEVLAASNGLRFAKSQDFTHECAQAGLNNVYLQFDGMTEDIYEQSRGRPLFSTKMQAMENLRQAGIKVTLVPTIVRGLNDHQIGDIFRFAVENTDVVSAVSFQPVSLTGRIDASKRREMRYTMADMARDLEEQDGAVGMHEDWYPYSIVNPISRLTEALTGQPKVHFNCHPHCGVASYLLVDRETKEVTPFTRFLDIEGAMADINKEAKAIESRPWRQKLTRIQMLRTLKKHFRHKQAPAGLSFDHIIEFVNTFIRERDESERLEFHKLGERFDALLLTAMHFQDNYNFEIERVQNCVIHYAAPDGRFYPFCTWNSGPCHRKRLEEHYSKPLK